MSCFFLPDLPPVYSYPSIPIGYKAGPSPPAARLAEHTTMEAEPAEPTSKSLPITRPFPALSRHEDEVGDESEEEDDNDCRIVEPLCAGAEKGREGRRRADLRECSVSIGSTPLREPFPLSASSPGPVPDPASPASAPGAASQRGELAVGRPPQGAGPEEDQRSHWARDQGGDREADRWEPTTLCGQRTDPGPAAAAAAAPPTALPLPQVEGEMVEVVEDDKEEEAEAKEDEETDVAIGEPDVCGAPSCPASSPPSSSCSSSSAPPEGACSSSSSSTSAYMWSLELLIAAALCATRDAVQGPPRVAKATVVPARGPHWSAHPGMEILGELADLEIQQRRRQTEGKETGGEPGRGRGLARRHADRPAGLKRDRDG